jgi:hypothetical protein
LATKIRKTGGFAVESEGKVLFWLAAKAGFTLAVVCASKHVEKARDEDQDQSGV